MESHDTNEDPLPVFRHFTRTEFAKIQRCILENKAREEKKNDEIEKIKEVRQ